MRRIYIDTETTGLKSKVNGIIELTYYIPATGAKGSIKMNPFSYTTTYSPKALEINSYTVEQVKEFQTAKEAAKEFYTILTDDYKGKYMICAYNAQFDKDFVETWLNKNNYTFHYLFTHKVLDTLQLVLQLQELGIIDTGKSQALASVAKHFNIEYIPHTCESDLNALVEIQELLEGALDFARAHIGQYIDKDE